MKNVMKNLLKECQNKPDNTHPFAQHGIWADAWDALEDV